MSQDKPIPDAIDGTELRFAVMAAGYNGELVDALLRRREPDPPERQRAEPTIVVVACRAPARSPTRPT
jgi:hypothetical protein